MDKKKVQGITDTSLPLGHSLRIDENTKPKGKLHTFSVPRSSLFQSLDAFLPKFQQSCNEVQREVAETGTTRYAVEELISDSDSDSDASTSSSSSSNSEMSVETKDKSNVPVVEMRLAVAPMETVEMIEKAESTLPDPTQTKKDPTPLVNEI